MKPYRRDLGIIRLILKWFVLSNPELYPLIRVENTDILLNNKGWINVRKSNHRSFPYLYNIGTHSAQEPSVPYCGVGLFFLHGPMSIVLTYITKIKNSTGHPSCRTQSRDIRTRDKWIKSYATPRKTEKISRNIFSHSFNSENFINVAGSQVGILSRRNIVVI